MLKERQELLEILKPPRRPCGVPTKEEWLAIESDLGLKYPEDLKWFVGTYGDGGLWGDIEFVNPSNTLPERVRLTKRSMLEIRDIFTGYPYDRPGPEMRYYPDAGGLVYFGCNSGGVNAFFVTEGRTPNRWQICVHEGLAVEWHELGFLAFVLGLCRGNVETVFLGSGCSRPVFKPFDRALDARARLQVRARGVSRGGEE